MRKLDELSKLGQSVWYDYIQKSFLTSGGLKKWIDKGARGVTSNPSIFSKAIADSKDYDDDIKRMMSDDKTIHEIYESLVLKDIAMAADQLKGVYDSSECLDGYVSLEVRPSLAHDTEKTVLEAKDLFERLKRPNVMIKVPATPAGIPAIQELIASGVNVNVTLLFSLESYKAAAEAYLAGLERLAKTGPMVSGGLPVNKISSVASFFISRVDSEVDRLLEKENNLSLKGKIAIANAKVVYGEFKKLFKGSRWDDLAKKGAQFQRVLWASTSTKNPEYPDTIYVDQLIGPHTVNTVPPSTLDKFIDHGMVKETLTEGLKEAQDHLIQLAKTGIDLDIVTQKLLDEGIEAFAKPFDLLMKRIAQKGENLLAPQKNYTSHIGDYQSHVDKAIGDLRELDVINRIWAHDHTLWNGDSSEIANRLGWLDSPLEMVDCIEKITLFVDEIRNDGYSHVVLLGMGGSSLIAEVFCSTFGVKKGYLDLAVLDSTDPGAIKEVEDKIDLSKTLFILSSKSGSTVESLSFFKYFYNKTLDSFGKNEVGKHFVAITDPHSSLEDLGKKLSFRSIFLNNPQIGGRYSALSYFGLVPAALIGMDLNMIIEKAQIMLSNAKESYSSNSAVKLGVTIGELAGNGRDKLTMIISPSISSFGSWVEQLIAESTGKKGRGILPIVSEAIVEPEKYGDDRLFVYIKLYGEDSLDKNVEALINEDQPVVELKLNSLYDLCQEFFRWEMATAIAGMRIGINPFDQPDVEASKVVTRNILKVYQKEGKLPSLPTDFQLQDINISSDLKADTGTQFFEKFFEMKESDKTPSNANKGYPRRYVAIQAYLHPSSKIDAALQDLRVKILQKYGMAVTLGYGPRFLHSTGQLHKGDGGNGLFIQFIASNHEDISIPDEPGSKKSLLSFGVLKNAQAMGDRQALTDNGRKVITFNLGGDIVENIKKIGDLV